MDNNENKKFDGVNGCYESPTSNNYNNPYDTSYRNNQNNMSNLDTTNSPDYIVWLALGIIQIIMLCCFNIAAFVAGILTVIFVVRANNYYKQGKMQSYISKMKVAKIINLAGWGLMVVNFVFCLCYGLFGLIKGIIS